MKLCRRIVCILLAAVLLAGVAPVLAADRSEVPDYFRVEHDGPQLPGQYTLSEGRILGGGIDGGIVNTFTVSDDFYYALAPDETITVTNDNASETGFVYLYCTVFHPEESYVSFTGETVEIPGGYFRELDTNRYILGADGQWIELDDGRWLLGAVLEVEKGMMLHTGESYSATLPEMDADEVALLYVMYMDPAVNPDYYERNLDYTEYQRNVYTVRQATVAGFTDVTEDAYYAEAVRWAVDNGVTSGTSATTFSPAASVTRAQAVTFLWRAAGSPAPASDVSPFTDVTEPDAYYYQAVLWAAEQGITTGVSADTFGLNGTLAYDQILTFLCRAAGETAEGENWSDAAMAWAADNGLTEGLDLSAKADCPRSDVVYCLWKQLA